MNMDARYRRWRIVPTIALGASLGLIGVAMLETSAHAQRPTDGGGGLTFDATDVVENWDEPTGAVRVHYSVSGPNVTVLDDNDSDGVPDFAQMVAITTAAVMDYFEQDLGFRRPIPESEFGLGTLGGSPAFDVYLVSFGGGADGAYSVDECRSGPQRCVGYFTMENDFAEYNYPSLEVAANVLTSHELFHAVQAAYSYSLSSWLSEGTATWAEKQWDIESEDFIRLTGFYLGDTGRALDNPPGGPVSGFAYGTALWFDFMSLRSDPSIITTLMNAVADIPDVDGMAIIEELLGGPEALTDEFIEFVIWNLASGPSSGVRDSYPYADELLGIFAAEQGAAIEHDNRFFPLAATYYLLEHGGGPIYFGAEEAAPGLSFGLHPVENGAPDGPILPSVARWTAEQRGSFAVGDGEDFPAGGYWIWASKAVRAETSTRVRICLGNEAAATVCAPLIVIEPPPPPMIDEGCTISTTPRRGSGSGVLFGFALMLGVLVARRSRAKN